MAKNTNLSDWPFAGERFLAPYNDKSQGQFAIDDNDVGTPNVRLRSTRARRFLELGFFIGNSDWGEFEQWRKFTILQGALPFNIPDPQNFNPGDPNTWLVVRFAVEQMDNACWTEQEWSALNGYTMRTILEVL